MQHQVPLLAILSNSTLPFCGPNEATIPEQRFEDAVLFVCAIFYSGVVLFGFRVYVVLWKQQKYKLYFLSLIYFFGQSVCLLRIAQYIAFYVTIRKAQTGGFCSMN